MRKILISCMSLVLASGLFFQNEKVYASGEDNGGTPFGTSVEVEVDDSVEIVESDDSEGFLIEEIESLTGSSLEGYNYVEYNEPISEYFGETDEVLLGYFEVPVEQPGEMRILSSYREYDRWYVYDQGIVKSWSYLSNPYFITSVPRGGTVEHEKETTVEATISASFSGIPSGSKSSVNRSFGLNSSGSKKVKVRVSLSGPGKGYSSRDFYYKKGRHTHKVKIVQERRSNQHGKLWTKTHYGQVGKPAIKYYSVDRK